MEIIDAVAAILREEERILPIAKWFQRCTQEWLRYQWHQASINMQRVVQYSEKFTVGRSERLFEDIFKEHQRFRD